MGTKNIGSNRVMPVMAGLGIGLFLMQLCLTAAIAAQVNPAVEFIGELNFFSNQPTIAFIIKENPGTIDLTKTKLVFDGVSTDYGYKADKGIVYWTPGLSLSSGNYEARLELVNTDGSAFTFRETVNVPSEFMLTGSLPYPNPSKGDTITFRFHTTSEPSDSRISVYDLSENLIFRDSIAGVPGINEYAWDCRYDGGEKVPYGSYYYVVEATSYGGTTARARGRFTLIP